jgi:uridine phosphorylase
MWQSYGTSGCVGKSLSTGDSVVHRSAIDPSGRARPRRTVAA